MTGTDADWAQRHVALMRTQRGHQCFVPGCTGSQPLMWVPTELEVRAESHPRGRAIDFPPRDTGLRRSPSIPAMPDFGYRSHIHWAR
jgi:hypothetical protein